MDDQTDKWREMAEGLISHIHELTELSLSLSNQLRKAQERIATLSATILYKEEFDSINL